MQFKMVCPECNLIVEPYAKQVLNDGEILHEPCSRKRDRNKHLRLLLLSVTKQAIRVESHRQQAREQKWPSWTMHFDTEC